MLATARPRAHRHRPERPFLDHPSGPCGPTPSTATDQVQIPADNPFFSSHLAGQRHGLAHRDVQRNGAGSAQDRSSTRKVYDLDGAPIHGELERPHSRPLPALYRHSRTLPLLTCDLTLTGHRDQLHPGGERTPPFRSMMFSLLVLQGFDGPWRASHPTAGHRTNG